MYAEGYDFQDKRIRDQEDAVCKSMTTPKPTNMGEPSLSETGYYLGRDTPETKEFYHPEAEEEIIFRPIAKYWAITRRGETMRVPTTEAWKKDVFDKSHQISPHLHRGIKQTQRLIKNIFFWKDMSRDIRRWSRECATCDHIT